MPRTLMLVVISGVLVAFSFPLVVRGYRLPWFSWLGFIALVPLFVAQNGASPRRSWCFATLATSLTFGISFSWVFRALHTYGGLSAMVSVLLTVTLVLVYAMYLALASFLAALLKGRFSGEALFWVPCCWTVVEFARSQFPFGGFPWASIAMSQAGFLPVIQIVDVVGVSGLIFFLIFINQFFSDIILSFSGREKVTIRKITVSVSLILLALGYGTYRLITFPSRSADLPSLTVGVIQGNIDQGEKWDERHLSGQLGVYESLARKLSRAGVELIVWPEAALPQVLSAQDDRIDPITLGVDPSRPRRELPFTLLGSLTGGGEGTLYNSALLFDAEGSMRGRHDKVHLVPFGEYVPYPELFFFAKKITRPIGKFIAGRELLPLDLGRTKIGALICYEDIFPEISRRLVSRGAELLVNLTNDAWYGISAAPYHHLALSVFRAVENRRYLIRATNSGVSAIIDPVGRIVAASPLFEQLVQVGPVKLIRHKTFVTKFGDWFAWCCVVALVVGIALLIWQRKKTKFSEDPHE